MSSATVIKDLLYNNWDLAGELSKTPTDEYQENIHFYDHAIVQSNDVTKSIVIQKINSLQAEGRIEHPTFVEISDLFEITVMYKVVDVDDSQYSIILDNVEEINDKILSILFTRYNPSTNDGKYFRSSKNWLNEDKVDGRTIKIKRRLFLRLSRNEPNHVAVYSGYPAYLKVSTDSIADNDPVPTQIFTQIQNVEISEGWESRSTMTKDKTNGTKVPYLRNGAFSGTFSVTMMGRHNEILGTQIDKLQNITKPQSNSPLKNQLAEIVFVNSNDNDSSQTIAQTIHTKITNIQKISSDEDLLRYNINGSLIKPSTYAEVP